MTGPLPPRVPADLKEGILKVVDEAVALGSSHGFATALLGVSDDRVHRWRRRLRQVGTLIDRAPGGHAMHGLTPQEMVAVLELAEQWGPIDRSHRKLAYRGSYINKVWVSPATVRRVLADHGLILPAPPPRPPTPRQPWPDWLVWKPNRIWCWDSTHWPRARLYSFAIVDVVSRKWIATLTSAEESSTQVRVVFDQALADEGLTELITPERVELPLDDPHRPILLLLSDNGAPMTSRATREFMALCAIAQKLGRPGTPADQAWIESLFGHLKSEWPHLDTIRDPHALHQELTRVRQEYNEVRLHASLGYVTPADEHQGRGRKIRLARRRGLVRARKARLAYHRQHADHPEETSP